MFADGGINGYSLAGFAGWRKMPNEKICDDREVRWNLSKMTAGSSFFNGLPELENLVAVWVSLSIISLFVWAGRIAYRFVWAKRHWKNYKIKLSDGGVPAGTRLVFILMINDCDDIIVIGMLAVWYVWDLAMARLHYFD